MSEREKATGAYLKSKSEEVSLSNTTHSDLEEQTNKNALCCMEKPQNMHSSTAEFLCFIKQHKVSNLVLVRTNERSLSIDIM